MMIKRAIYIVAAMALLWSCSSTDEPSAAVKAGFSIKSRAMGPVSDNELINSWWVMLVGTDGVIADVAEGTAAGVERQSFETEVNKGVYRVYAFANIGRGALARALGLEPTAFDKGAVLAADFDGRTMDHGAIMDADEEVPMSGRLGGVRISDRVEESFAIEVVRMWGKVEFEFSNSSGRDIEVTGVTFGPLYSGPAALFAYGVPGKPELAEGVKEHAQVEYAFGEAASVPAGSDGVATRHFYVHETTSEAHPTGKYRLSVKLRRDGAESEELFALTEDLTWINRNDHILIPIDFLDWSLRFDCKFAPPIGGYPAVLIEEVNEEYYIRFGSSGRFTLSALVREGPDGDYLSPDRMEFDIVSVEDPAGILDGKPVAEDGGVTGYLSDQPGPDGGERLGRATIELAVRVKDGPADHVFNRKFYIIRDKK